jgi:Secretion system C-terminal sorting domain
LILTLLTNGGAMKTFNCFFVLVILLVLPINVSAQESIFFQVVPSDYTSIPGNGSFLGPLYSGARTYQLLIHEDLLTNLVGEEIQALSWRIVPAASSNWPPIDVTVPNYDLYLSGSVTPANRSLTDFSANVVGPQKQVRSGSLFIPMNSYPSGNSPNDWGPEIMFDSLYLYTGGNLLIELRLTGTGTTNQSTDALTSTAPGFGTLFSACWGSSYTANSGSNGNFSIVRLTADDPVPVELTSFTSSVSDNNVILQWTTATETNNYGFEIQRKSSNSGYEVLGFVTGSGTTTEPRTYFFTDSKIPNGQYTYRLKQTDYNGTFSYSDEIVVEVDAPAEYALDQNYPNPFNPSTNINFSLAEAGIVKMAVYNLLGQKVAIILDEFREAGLHSVTFNASELPSGAYFYTIETSQFKQTKKMLLAK